MFQQPLVDSFLDSFTGRHLDIVIIYISINLSIYQSMNLSINLLIYQSINQSIYPHVDFILLRWMTCFLHVRVQR